MLATDNAGAPLRTDPSLTRGQSIRLIITGLTPGASYDVTVHSAPIDLGSMTADRNGTITYSFTPPPALGGGSHSVQVTGRSGLAAAFVFELSGSAAGGTTLAVTGSAVSSMIGLALVLLIAGVVLLGVFGRRKLVRGRHS